MKKALVYSIQEQLTEGVFGQVMTWVLEILPYLEEQGYRPENVIWDIHTVWYGKVVPGMFIPKTACTDDDPCNYFNLVQLKWRHSHHFGFENESFRKANDFLNRWFDIPSMIYEQLPEFPQNKRTLGLHYRGTDKNRDPQTNPLTADEFIILAKDFMASRGFDSIFVCSDEDGFPDRVQRFFAGIEVSEIEQIRSKDNKPLFMKSPKGTDDLCREMMFNTLRDAMALSKCTAVLKCSSSFSAWAKILNPECEVYQVSAMKFPWFPGGAIPPYSPCTNIAKNIMRYSMVGDNMTQRLRRKVF